MRKAIVYKKSFPYENLISREEQFQFFMIYQLKNYPAQKGNNQVCSAEIASNIASCIVYVERFVGCSRDYSILSSVWPGQKMDILSLVC